MTTGHAGLRAGKVGSLVAALLATCVAVVTTQPSSASTGPTPGTKSEVAALVARSVRITKLDKAVTAQLRHATSDTFERLYPEKSTGCLSATQCVYGDSNSSKFAVLIGDSHAVMWLPALVPTMQTNGYKLVVLWRAGCQVASVTIYDEPPESPGGASACKGWLSSAIGIAKSLNPALILIGERTAEVYAAPNKLFTESKWQRGLESTISKLKSVAAMAILEDIVWENYVPAECLVSNPNAVQKCSVPNPNIAAPGQQVAEKKAAAAEHIGFIPTTQWLCTTTKCSSVVGDYITHWDQGHLSATYAQYLTGVLADALVPYMN